MRTLYIQSEYAHAIKNVCHVLFVSPLLRELIVRAMELPALYDERGMEGRVMRLIVDEIARLPAQPLGLRMPSDPRLLRLCDLVLGDLANPDSIAQLGASVGLSERSVTRLFPLETGPWARRRWRCFSVPNANNQDLRRRNYDDRATMESAVGPTVCAYGPNSKPAAISYSGSYPQVITPILIVDGSGQILRR